MMVTNRKKQDDYQLSEDEEFRQYQRSKRVDFRPCGWHVIIPMMVTYCFVATVVLYPGNRQQRHQLQRNSTINNEEHSIIPSIQHQLRDESKLVKELRNEIQELQAEVLRLQTEKKQNQELNSNAPSTKTIAVAETRPATSTSTATAKRNQKETEKKKKNSFWEYIEAGKGLGYQGRRFMSLVSWDPQTGRLEDEPLRLQCASRNYHPSARHPYTLSYIKHEGNSTTTPLEIVKAKPSEYGTMAIMYTIDNNSYRDVNWAYESPPVPILALTAPIRSYRKSQESVNPWIHLIPTPYELYGNIRMIMKDLDPKLIDFTDRIPKIMYRGDPNLNKSRKNVMTLGRNESNQHWLNATETHLSRFDMIKYKYLFDVGGISRTTWSALRWKMCSGSLVFRLIEQDPYMDWWYDSIQEWKHYIPVKWDTSDLYDQWRWAEKHPDKARQIAQAGQTACRASLSRESNWEALQNVINQLPPATKTQREEIEEIYHNASQYLDALERSGNTSNIFLPGVSLKHKTPAKDKEIRKLNGCLPPSRENPLPWTMTDQLIFYDTSKPGQWDKQVYPERIIKDSM